MEGDGILVYIAGPLFSQAEKEFNEKLKRKLSDYVETYLPQDEGQLLVDLLKSGESAHNAAKIVVERDLTAIEKCDLFVIVLDGRTVEEGSAFELGIAFEKKKKCIGVQTDPRREISTINNPMIELACSRIFGTIEELIFFIRDEIS